MKLRTILLIAMQSFIFMLVLFASYSYLSWRDITPTPNMLGDWAFAVFFLIGAAYLQLHLIRDMAVKQISWRESNGILKKKQNHKEFEKANKSEA